MSDTQQRDVEIYRAYLESQRLKAELGIKAIAKRFNLHPRTVQKIIEEERARTTRFAIG